MDSVIAVILICLLLFCLAFLPILILLALYLPLFYVGRLVWHCTRQRRAVVIFLLLVPLALIVVPFWHVLLQSAIFAFKQDERLAYSKITDHVHDRPWNTDFPESVFLEDYQFSHTDRLERYLDGSHLKMLAMKGKEDKIYLYRAEGDPFAEARRCVKEVEEKWESVDFRAMGAALSPAEKNAEDAAALKAHRQQMEKEWEAEWEADWKACVDLCAAAGQRLRESAQVFEDAAKLPPMRYTVRTRHEGCDSLLSLYRTSQMDIVYPNGEQAAFARSYEGCLNWWQKMLRRELYIPKPLKGPGVHDKEAFRDRVLFPYAKPWPRELYRYR